MANHYIIPPQECVYKSPDITDKLIGRGFTGEAISLIKMLHRYEDFRTSTGLVKFPRYDSSEIAKTLERAGWFESNGKNQYMLAGKMKNLINNLIYED